MKGGQAYVEKYLIVIAINLIFYMLRLPCRKLLKATYTEEHSVNTNSEVAIFNSDRKNQFNSKEINEILQSIIIDLFRRISIKIIN